MRIKGGSVLSADTSGLLEYLGLKKETSGLHKVASDVELIASVPFLKSKEQLAGSNEGGFAWTLSTFDLDRYAERIDPAGWDFSRYMDNPVVEWAHRYDIPAIGKIEELSITDEGLRGVVFFNSKEYDLFGWSVGERVKAGVIRAGSVGFRPVEIEIPSKANSADGTSLIFRKQELLEFSICNVPANPFALAKGINESERTEHKQELNFSGFWGGLINTF